MKPPGRRSDCARPGVAALVAGAVLFASASYAEPSRQTEPPITIAIEAKRIDSFDPRDTRRRFGQLEFRGGLELRSSYAQFGGISAIRVAPDGAHFIAVTDHGRWLRGRIVHDGRAPAGIADAEMAPMRGPDGRPLGRTGWHDAESLAQDGGYLYVGIERVNQIVRFGYGEKGLLARGQPIPVPSQIKDLPRNLGLEALAFVPKGLPLAGTLIAISERGLDAAGNIIGILLGGPTPGPFSVRRSDDFDITDLALLPKGDLLILERRYTLLRGVAMRIRRIPVGAVEPQAVLDGPVLIEADMGYQIDNMEGLAVHRTPEGETVLTIVSDDNFSPLQRTLLLQFTLVDDQPP